MTREKAKDILNWMYGDWKTEEEQEAIAVAVRTIKAIDDIKAEIGQLPSYVAKFAGGSFAIHIDKEKVLQIIDKHTNYGAKMVEPQESEETE